MSLREEDEANAENTDAVDRDPLPADDLALEIPRRYKCGTLSHRGRADCQSECEFLLLSQCERSG